MARVKARRTKATLMQARVENRDKAILQKYADQQGITLSELIRMTLRNLADVVDLNKRT